MALHEQDREDLLREATALVERAELTVSGIPENVIVGFRRGGEASVFFGGDPVYQFNAAGELRRAYCAGKLIKAERGRLVELDRRRDAGQVQLVRHELDDLQSAEFLRDCRQSLRVLHERLIAGDFTCVGCVPADVNVVGRVQGWVANLPDEIPIAARPHIQ